MLGGRASSVQRTPKYLQTSVWKEEKSVCPLAMVLWLDQWVSDLVLKMTHAKELFGVCTEPSDTIMNLLL